MSKIQPISFRPDTDLWQAVMSWKEKNPDIDQTTLINMALREFISKEQVLVPVEIEAKDLDKKFDEMMTKHSEAIERLK